MCDCRHVITGPVCPGCGHEMCGECEMKYGQCLDCAADEAESWNAQQQCLAADDDDEETAVVVPLPVVQGCPNGLDLLDDGGCDGLVRIQVQDISDAEFRRRLDANEPIPGWPCEVGPDGKVRPCRWDLPPQERS